MLYNTIYRKFSTHFLSSPEANVNLLRQFGIINPTIYRNLTVPEYYEKGMNFVPSDTLTRGNALSSTGAFVSYSGKNTGQLAYGTSFVNDPIRQRQIAWGQFNRRIPSTSFQILEDLAINYFNTRNKLFVVDGYAGWDLQNRLRIRGVCTRAYHALFLNNMLVKPTLKELEQDFSEGADYYIFNAGVFNANKYIPGVIGDEILSLNLQQRKIIILGTQYAGQMKKGISTVMNYLMSKNGNLPLLSSCNVGTHGDAALFCGVSSTGKTSLSASGNRDLIGDDMHVWTDTGIFNIEGGCYAKCMNLSSDKQPEIFNAIKFGTILENVSLKRRTRQVNYFDSQFTENIRAAYPLEFIPNARIPAKAGHPKNIIFLTCDAFSVFPPVSKLTKYQALYHFYSGYTSKIAGTQQGIKEPIPTFSACFGEEYLPFKPQIYADLLAQKLQNHSPNVWLINTGWSGGKYGVGKRISITNTRNIINAIHDGTLQKSEMKEFPIFKFRYPTFIEGVNPKILNPSQAWKSKQEYQETLEKVALMFKENFNRFEHEASEMVKMGGPQI